MPKCPSCGERFSPLYLKPHCPHCGVNLVYFDMEARLEQDAAQAEAEYEALGCWLKRVRRATIQGPVAIIRLICAFLPVVAVLLLPMYQVAVTLPFVDEGWRQITGLSTAQYLLGANYGAIQALSQTALLGAGAKQMLAGAVCFAAAVLCAVLLLLLVAFSYTRHGNLRNIIVNVLAIVFSAAAAVLFNGVITAVEVAGLQLLQGYVGYGMYVLLGVLAVYLVLNIVMLRRERRIRILEQYAQSESDQTGEDGGAVIETPN